uniref:Uncharacterized protein n=1 Tax=Avena sativa TaxID=4498 RepID=A0ACD5U196_AVESA
MDIEDDGYHTEEENEQILEQNEDEQYQALSEDEMSHEILRMIINSVQKRERRKSASKQKRKRSTLNIRAENGSDADDERKAYSRCSITYLCKVLDKVRSCARYVELVQWLGFAEILHLDDCCVPRPFVQWVADNVCTDGEAIIIGSKQIELNPQSVHHTLGTPTGDLPVNSDEELGKAAFLAMFGLLEVPSVRFFGKLIFGKEVLPDAVFCRAFMSVCLGTFFCPNSSTKISTKYMGALVIVDKIKDRNWSKFIHEWMMFYIKKYLKQPANTRQLTQTLGGCIYHLAVRCLDFIDFTPVQIPSTIPRIRVWKGNLIKLFSDMFLGTNGKYGAYPVKDISETCYFIDTSIPYQQLDSDTILKQLIHGAIGDLVGDKLKEEISATFLTIMKDEDMKYCMKAQDLVIKVIQAILSTENGSQDTLKLTASDECSNKNTNDSESTVKLNQDDEVDSEYDNDEDVLIQRKRRRTESNTNSKTSHQTENAINKDMNSDYPQSTHVVSPVDKETTGNEDARSQAYPSASLDHMILANDIKLKGEASIDVSTQVFRTLNNLNDTKESIMDLNVKCVEEQNEEFHGFNASDVKSLNIESIEHGNNNDHSEGTEQGAPSLDECYAMNKEIDVNLPTIQLIAQDYARDQPTQTFAMKRSELLQIARSKYYFNDDGMPSFRLMECVDDNGRTIEEPELHRPLEMDDYTYNEKCELAISNCKEIETCNEARNKLHAKQSPDANITASKSSTRNGTKNKRFVDNIDSDCENSIYCAQREPTNTGLTNSPTRPWTQTNNFVDLVSPTIPLTSNGHVNQKQSSSTNKSTPYYGKAIIVGRTLFDSNDEDYFDSDMKNKSPVRNC